MPLTAQGLCTNCGTAVSVHALGGLCPACVSGDLFGDFVEEPNGAPHPVEELGHIGPYRLIEEIGEGGFAVVYRAEQSGTVRREVALKVIKKGMDSRQVIARFEAEQQAVAMMDHPDIATVFDAGTTEDGRPYFAMELVEGQPVTEFVEQNELDLRAKIELMIRICDAVEHAHRRGIIHRDLKPSNILVGEADRTPNSELRTPTLKVIDFGIAKATEHLLTESTLVTAGGQLLGTPGYMSPEQATLGRADVDTRTDVYALGIVLYELLAGRPAWSRDTLNGLPIDKLLSLLHEGEPPRPSKHTPGLPADLNWITGRAIARERERRYGSAAQLGRDLKRFLGGEPIEARPPSTAYRVGKFVRRNKLAVALSTLVAAAVVIGSISSAVFAIRAEKRRTEAETAKREARLSYSSADLGMAREAAATGRAAEGVAYLCRALRTDPENHAAAQTLLHELVYRGFPQATAEPQSIGYAAEELHALSDDRFLVLSPGGKVSLWQKSESSISPLEVDFPAVVDRVSARAGGQTFALRSPTTGWQAFGDDAMSLSSGIVPGAEHAVLSTDGKVLSVVVGSQLVGFDSTSGEELWRSETAGAEARPTAFGDAGEREHGAVGFDNGSIVVFSTTSGRVLADLSVPGGKPVSHLAMAKSWLLASLDGGSTAYRFRLGRKDEPLSLEAKAPIRGLAITPGGDTSAVWTSGSLVLFTDGKPSAEVEGTTSSVAFSPDGHLLAIDHGRGRLGTYDTDNGEPVSMAIEHQRPFAGLAFASSGLTAITTTGTVHAWKGTPSYPDLVRLEHGETPYIGVFFHPVGDSISTIEFAGTSGNFSPATGAEHSMYSDYPFLFPIVPLDLTPSGMALIFAGKPNLKDLTHSVGSMYIHDTTRVGSAGRPLQHDGGLSYGQVSDDGLKAIIGSHNGSVTLYDVDSGEPVNHWQLASSRPTFPMEISIDDRHAVTVGMNSAFALQLEPPYDVIEFPHQDLVSWVRVSPDGDTVATGSHDNTARLWSISRRGAISGPLRHDEIASEDGIGVAFSPDGRYLVSGGSADHTARVWNVATGELAVDPLPHGGVVRNFDWAPKLDRLITACDDGYSRLWDASSGGLLAPPWRHPGPTRDYESEWFGAKLNKPIQHVNFDSNSGRRVLAAASFGGVEVYELAPPDTRLGSWFLDFAEALVGKRFNDRGVIQPVPVAELAAWRIKLADLPLEEGTVDEQTAAWLNADPAQRPRTPLAPWRPKGPSQKYRPDNPPWYDSDLNDDVQGFNGEH